MGATFNNRWEENQPTLTVPLFRVLDALIQKGKPYCACNQNIEKQGEQSIKWNKNTEGNKPQKNHPVLIKTTHGIAEGEWNGGEHWIQYRWLSSIKDSDVLFWIELSDIEEQGEQKPVNTVKSKFKVGDWCIDNEDGTIFQMLFTSFLYL